MAIRDLIFLKQRRVEAAVYRGYILNTDTSQDIYSVDRNTQIRAGFLYTPIVQFTSSGATHTGLAKISTAGAVQWIRRHNGSDGFETKFHPTADGGVVIATESSDGAGASFPHKLYKLNSGGALVWTRTLSSDADRALRSTGAFAEDSTGAVYFTAIEDNFVQGFRVILYKYSSLGVLAWTRVFDAGGEDEFGSTAAPTVTVAGDEVYWATGSVIFGATPAASIRVAKLNSSGATLWATKIPTPTPTLNAKRRIQGLYVVSGSVCVHHAMGGDFQNDDSGNFTLDASSGAVQSYKAGPFMKLIDATTPAVNSISTTGKVLGVYDESGVKYVAIADAVTGTIELRRKIATGAQVNRVIVDSSGAVYVTGLSAGNRFTVITDMTLAVPTGDVSASAGTPTVSLWNGAPEVVSIAGTDVAVTPVSQTILSVAGTNAATTSQLLSNPPLPTTTLLFG